MMEQFKPRQVSLTEIRMWENLVSSQYQLKISALGKDWKFRFLLGLGAAPLPKNAITVSIRLGDYCGVVQSSLLPAGRWLSEILHGVGVETLTEPFRSAVIAVLLQDFFSGLSETSRLPLQLVESPFTLGEPKSFTLHWQMANDCDEPEIIGSLTAEEGLIVQVQAAAATWPVIPRRLPESLQVLVDLLIGTISLSGKEYDYLEVGDVLLIGPVKHWRKKKILLRIYQGIQSGPVIPINSLHSSSDDILSLMKKHSEEHSKNDKDESSVEEAIGSTIPHYSTSNKEANPITHESSDQWLDTIEVTLEFSLGRQRISLGELRRIGQGHHFPIQAPADSFVNILLQGKRIGRGELIRVGEELGILVREFEFEQISPASQINAGAVMAEKKECTTRE